MIRFIWQNWWRRKERFILLIIGAFVVSAGLTYLIGLSETNKGTIVDNLQQRWSASYDIVVRPEGTRSVTEEKKLLEPNYLSGISGGISIQQYETIKDIPGVEVAAPIAMIGYANYQVNFAALELDKTGIYRITQEEITNNGVYDIVSSYNRYGAFGNWDIVVENLSGRGSTGVGTFDGDLGTFSQVLLAGIDPEQEAKLVGLDDSIAQIGGSRYFNQTDAVDVFGEFNSIQLPVIVSNHAYVEKKYNFTVERLDIPFDQKSANETIDMIQENDGEEYLNTIEGVDTRNFSFTEEESFNILVNSITGLNEEKNTPPLVDKPNSEVEEETSGGTLQGFADGTWINDRPSPLQYSPVTSPFTEQWPFAYAVEKIQTDPNTRPAYIDDESYREPISFGDTSQDWPRIKPMFIGFYDPSKLEISQDPTTELPMETYRPATAQLVIDSKGEPVNPPKTLKPTDNPYGFLTNPPGMLTTIEAATAILGDEPISAIRIKVAGVTDLGEESQNILETVAAEIEKKTGLITDITLGSSPQPTLTYVPAINDQEAIGWFQQPWVNVGSSISIYREAEISFTGVVASVIVVAVVYVWASGIVSLLSRRKEFAVLLSVGWRPSHLSRILLLESLIIGTFVAIISWMMLGFVYVSSEATISFNRFFWTGLFGLIIYLLGAVIPMLLTRNISSYEDMRTGEISGNSKRLFRAKGINRMAFNHFIGKWKRSILSIISIALPTGLLAVFLYITFRLRGIMYTSLLGEYVALEIGPAHYVAIIVSLIIAILTTAEITWQNVSERKEEISLLQAIGWKRWSIRRLILAEGVFSGLFAAIIGLTLAFLMMWGLYGAFPTEEIGFILGTGLIPIIIGLIGTIFPAERAVRIVPNQGIGGNYSNQKAIERRMKWVVISTIVLLVGTFLFTMIRVAPNIERSDGGESIEQAFNPTEGDIVDKGTKAQVDQGENSTNPEENGTSDIPGKYLLEFSSDETSKDAGWGHLLNYSVKEVKSSLPAPETGMKNIALEYTFEILDNAHYEMLPKRHFSILVGEEFYYPVEATVIEAKAWEHEQWLNGYYGGKMKAILEFTVSESVERYGLLFKNSDGSSGKGIMVWFDKPQLDKE